MANRNVSQDFAFAAEPRVMKPRTKYREPPQEEAQQAVRPANIMFDPRVQRGNTYAPVVSTSREAAQTLRSTQNRSTKKSFKPLEATEYEAVQADVSTPRPVDGRRHAEIQTEEIVELLTDKPPEYEKEAQTDFYIDRPVNRLFVPQKIGEDRETQIWDGELFDFDYEVEPILQVLIGKALEQGRMEVLEEEEHRIMKEEQKRYDELRYAELAEAQKMEAEEKRKLDETERRKKQHRLKNDQSISSHKKFMCRMFAKQYLKNVRNNSFNILGEQGNFQNAFNFEINHTLLPWIFEDILQLQEGRNAVVDTIRTLNHQITDALADIHIQSINAEKERKKKVQEDKEKQEREKVERRQKRAEARDTRAEEERRALLQKKITDLLLAKGEQRQNLFAQVLSDLDSLGKDGMTVGLLGGVIGEILIILSTLEDFKAIPEDDPLAALRTIEITRETVQKIVDYVVGDLVKEGKVEIGVTGDIDAQLKELDPEMTLDNIHTKPAKAEEAREVLRASINSFVLNIIQQNAGQLALKSEYVEQIVDALINGILNPDEKVLRVKLVKAPLDYSQDARFEAIAALMPDIQETPLFNLLEAKGVKPKRQRKGSKKESLQNLDEGKAPEEEPVVTPAEVDYEDLVSVIPLVSDQLRVLVHQRPASIVLRRQILIFLSTLFKELDMKEIEVLKKVNNKAEGIEEIVAGSFSKKLAVILFDRS